MTGGYATLTNQSNQPTIKLMYIAQLGVRTLSLLRNLLKSLIGIKGFLLISTKLNMPKIITVQYNPMA